MTRLKQLRSSNAARIALLLVGAVLILTLVQNALWLSRFWQYQHTFRSVFPPSTTQACATLADAGAHTLQSWQQTPPYLQRAFLSSSQLWPTHAPLLQELQVRATNYRQATSLQTALQTTNQLCEALSTGKHTIVVLLQNSDELRATGGFLGSYLTLHLDEGVLVSWDVHDSYDVAGQQTSTHTPPPGVSEYLSGGESWKLTDANWSPDFPTAVAAITSMLPNEHRPTLVIGVTDTVLEHILAVIGPIPLDDYGSAQLDQTSATDVLRTARGEFFPGSNQKQYVLEHALTQLASRVELLPLRKQLELALLFSTELDSKNILLWTDDAAVELPSAYTGDLIPDNLDLSRTEFLALVESNVGVNKANANVEREVRTMLDSRNQRWTITTTFANSNLPSTPTLLGESISEPSLGAGANDNIYVNYYRVIVPSKYEVLSIEVADQPVEWRTTPVLLNGVDDSRFQSIEYLVVVPESSTVTSTITLSTEYVLNSLYIWKQPGTPPFNIQAQSSEPQDTALVTQNKQLDLFLPINIK